MSELFTEKRWVGEFFSPNSHETRFSGEINYSPQSGLILSFTIRGLDLPEDTDELHGLLSSGEKCTLSGRSPTHSRGLNAKSGHLMCIGKAKFHFLTIGAHSLFEEKFNGIDFSLTNLQEFFHSNDDKHLIKFSEEPIDSISTPFGKLEINNNATFDSLTKTDITALFYSEDRVALKELGRAFAEVIDKYPNSDFMLKKDIAYTISLNFAQEISISEAYKHLTRISDLFALLIYKPVHPESIRLWKQGTDQKVKAFKIFPNMALDPRTITLLSTQNRPHYSLPITQQTASLNSIVSNWLQKHQSYESIISAIQHENQTRNTPAAHGEFVLYATLFESISHQAKAKANKYEYPLTHHANEKICDGLSTIFKKTSLNETAVAIADLRNEIAHVGRPQKWLETLSLVQIVRVSHYLQLTIIGYALMGIGVSKELVSIYQDCFSPK